MTRPALDLDAIMREATATRDATCATAGLRAARRAIEAAEAWLACPCEEHRSAWYLLSGPEGLPHWVPCAPSLVDLGLAREHGTAGLRGGGMATLRATEIQHAARLVGEPAVRAAIQRALIEWALAVPA